MKALKSRARNCGPLSEMIRGVAPENDLHVRLGHPFAQIPMHDGPAIAVQHAAQVIECAGDVDVGDIHVPVLVSADWLLEAGSLERRPAVPAPQPAGGLEHPVDAGRTDRHHIPIQHHEGQPPVALQRILGLERQDGLLLPAFQPVVAWDPGIVLVGPAIPAPPIVVLAGREAQPGHQQADGQPGLIRPAANEVYHLVAGVVGNPLAGQSSPSSFFNWMCS